MPTGFEGDAILLIQTGFNEEIVQQGTLVEEIHLLPSGTSRQLWKEEWS
jgi:hypothetical protein